MMNRLAIFAVTFCAVSAFSMAQGAEPLLVSGGTARLDTYEKDNTVFFALSIEPKAEDMVALTTDVVVLFDTSASQSGEYRTAALETLDNFLKNLGDNNTVKLVAVDVDANTLTDSFLAPQSVQMQDAFAKLNRRVPLGSTNMAKAIRAATESFTESGSDRRAVLYIGDGLSAAKTTSSPAFQAEVAECRKKNKYRSIAMRLAPIRTCFFWLPWPIKPVVVYSQMARVLPQRLPVIIWSRQFAAR
jgi:hypothetical protein